MRTTGHGNLPWPEAPYAVKCPDGTPKRETLRPAPHKARAQPDGRRGSTPRTAPNM
jgi:hypothetical protein